MTGNLWVDAVPEKVAEWKKYVAAIEAEKQELRPGEDEAFYGLRDYWKNGDFNPANCKKLIDIIKREANFHPNGWENMLLFLRLCVDYYTRNKDAFVAFQRALGGKQPRTTPQPPPPPPTRPQPVPPPPQRPTPPPPPRPPQPPRHSPPPQPPPEQRITFSDGYYVGDIQNGRATGVGKRYFTDAERRGSWQQGSFINGLLHGTNCVSYWAKSGRTDRGEYRNGVRAGKGRIEWSDGEVYEGEWNENGRHGLGIDRFPQQNYVERGIWSNDRRYLKGRMEWGNGNWYEGQWNENGRHGNGTHYWAANKRTDTGQYQNDVRKGKGVSKWANGNRYEGSWDDSSGQLNGEGVYYYADGRREKCRYVNGTYQGLGSSKALGGIGGWIWRSIPWWPIVAAAVCTVCLLFTDRVGKALIIGALALLGAGALYFFLEWAQGQLEKVRDWFIKWPRWLRIAFWIVVTGLIIKLIFVYKPHISLARIWLSGANRTEEIIRPESALAGTWTGVFNRENTTLIITEGDSSRFTAAISVGTNPVRQLHVALSDYPSVHLAPEQTQGNYSGEWNGAVQADTLFAGEYHNPRTGSTLPFSFIKKQSF